MVVVPEGVSRTGLVEISIEHLKRKKNNISKRICYLKDARNRDHYGHVSNRTNKHIVFQNRP